MLWILACLIHFVGKAHGTCNTEQYQALSSFYWATNGPSWRTRTNWMSDTDCSSGWFRVDLDGNGNVVQMNLDTKGVAAAAAGGTLPSELGLLSAITLFNMEKGALVGTIPCWLGLMTSMASFDIGFNSLTGRIPSWLGLMTKIGTANDIFRMRTNQLCGRIPLEVRVMSGGNKFKIESGNANLGTVCPGAVPSLVPTLYPTPLPSQPSPVPTSPPTLEPSAKPTPEPTFEPSPQPSTPPTPSPTREPSPLPTAEPSHPPSPQPSGRPTALPTARPTPAPTSTFSPTTGTGSPSSLPTPKPTSSPSPQPSSLPTLSLLPTPLPTAQPTHVPSPVPTSACGNGTFLNVETHECEICGIGRFAITYQKRDGREEAPQVRNCTLCPPGKYNIDPGSKGCLDCDVGKLSAPNRASCQDCKAGEYNYLNIRCEPCPTGQYAPTAQGLLGCLQCFAGDFTNNRTGATTCTACDAGTFSRDGAVECPTCAVGKFSLSRSANCSLCDFGKFSSSSGSSSCTACTAGFFQGSLGETGCDACPPGQNQPSTGSKLCLDCPAGKFSDEAASLGCDTCAIGYDSYEGSSFCSRAAVTYFLKEWDPEPVAADCPANAECAGGEQAPAPDTGFWVDRSSYDYADVIYTCFRETCTGGDKEDPCWHRDMFGEDSTDDDGSQCPSSKVQCSEGATAWLCGSCESGYLYSASTKTCTLCDEAQDTALLILGIVFLSLVVIGGVAGAVHLHESRKAEGKKNPMLQAVVRAMLENPCTKFGQKVVKAFDEGSIKVFWATEQIIMSCSWNLDISFPAPFNRLQRMLSIFSLDFLALECFQNSESKNYFRTSYMWSLIPLAIVGFIAVVYVLRVAAATALASMKLSKRRDQYGESPYELYLEEKTRVIKAQHFSAALLLSYCVLPPVAMKHFQALDCIPFKHDGSNYLRVDTVIDCHSTSYKNFQLTIIFFLVLYQSIPVLWFVMLYRIKDRLNPRDSPDINLALFIRDQDRHLDSLRFLFDDYKADAWWFEVAEMYRRTAFVGILPLLSPYASVRSSVGVIFAIASVAYYRERQPFRLEFTNFIAFIAQYLILLVFYAGLSLSTGQVMDFGLEGYGMGLFLLLCNMFVLSLVLYLAWSRFRDEQEMRRKIVAEAFKGFDDATDYTKGDFATEFKALAATSVPPNHVIAFHYTTAKTARFFQRAGLITESKVGGVLLSMRGPHQLTAVEADLFKHAVSPDGVMFEACIALAVPGRLLTRLDTHDDPFVRVLPTSSLLSLWPQSYVSVVDSKPWKTVAAEHAANEWGRFRSDGLAILPPACILNCYLLHMEVEEKKVEEMKAEVFRRRSLSAVSLLYEPSFDDDSDHEDFEQRRSFELAEEQTTANLPKLPVGSDHSFAGMAKMLQSSPLAKKRLIKLPSAVEFLKRMKHLRTICRTNGLVPVYHYTSKEVVPYVLEIGLRASAHSLSQGGVHFSTMGPASYGLGTDLYEENLIKDCFGLDKVPMYRGKGKLDAVVVYACHPTTLSQVPGGRDRERAVSLADFKDLSLPDADGNFFLRPDRILGVFKISPSNQPFIGKSFKEKIIAAALLEIERDNDIANSATIVEVARKQEDAYIQVRELGTALLDTSDLGDERYQKPSLEQDGRKHASRVLRKVRAFHLPKPRRSARSSKGRLSGFSLTGLGIGSIRDSFGSFTGGSFSSREPESSGELELNGSRSGGKRGAGGGQQEDKIERRKLLPGVLEVDQGAVDVGQEKSFPPSPTDPPPGSKSFESVQGSRVPVPTNARASSSAARAPRDPAAYEPAGEDKAQNATADGSTLDLSGHPHLSQVEEAIVKHNAFMSLHDSGPYQHASIKMRAQSITEEMQVLKRTLAVLQVNLDSLQARKDPSLDMTAFSLQYEMQHLKSCLTVLEGNLQACNLADKAPVPEEVLALVEKQWEAAGRNPAKLMEVVCGVQQSRAYSTLLQSQQKSERNQPPSGKIKVRRKGSVSTDHVRAGRTSNSRRSAGAETNTLQSNRSSRSSRGIIGDSENASKLDVSDGSGSPGSSRQGSGTAFNI